MVRHLPPFQAEQLPGLYLSPECLLDFLSNFFIPPCVGKMFKFMEFTLLENELIRGIFIHATPHSKVLATTT